MQAQALDVVTVVIVAYNSREALQRQCAELRRFERLIVVDNASSDGTLEWLAVALPQATVLRLPANVGFGRAHNLAMASCETPFALLLNPDCVIEPAAVAILANSLLTYGSALMAVPRLVYPDGRAQENHRAFFHRRGRQRPAYRSPDAETCCDMVSGAVLLVRVQLFQQLGGFDPWFFLYWEDEDLCIRARQQKMAVILAPEAVACHVAQTSSLPSLRGTFIRHYCYTSSKIYLRRKLHENSVLLVFRVLGTAATSLLSLPINLLKGDRHKAMRSVARLLAVLTAPLQLRRSRSVAMPQELWRKR